MKRLALLVLLLLAARSDVVRTADVSLAWDPPVDGITTGYVVAYGASSGTYTWSIDVGFVTSYAVTGLADGSPYCFVVEAYDAAHDLSGPSNEVCTTTAPAPLAVTLSANKIAPQVVGTTVTFSAAAGGGVVPYRYAWSVWTGTAWQTQSSTTSSFAWTPTVASTAYIVQVQVQDAAGASITGSMPFTITTAPTKPCHGAKCK